MHVDKDTPSFRLRSHSEENSNVFFPNSQPFGASYAHPDRYLYEFFQSRGYEKFRKLYLKALKRNVRINLQKESLPIEADPRKKFLFVELENVILYFSLTTVDNLPLLGYIDEDTAFEYNCKPFYLYLRPFAVSLFNKVTSKYNLAIYSCLDKDFITLLLSYMPGHEDLFTLCISNYTSNDIKRLGKFFDSGDGKFN